MTATTLEPTVQQPEPPHWADLDDQRSSLATLWSDTMVYASRNIAHIRQIPEKLLDVTLQPLMFVLLFAYVFGGAIAVSGGSYREYVIAGILMQSLAFGLTGPATAISTDLTEGVIDRFRSLPASRTAYLFGHYLAELGGLVLSIVVLLGAGLLVGWRT
ncbi:MAG: ABC transporter permease, partial [Acidimicrobiales bacterium]